MGEFELRVNPKQETWNIRVRGERSYYGVGNPYRDKEFSRLLDDLCDKEDVTSLSTRFQRYGFGLRPTMFLDYPDDWTPIEGSFDRVGSALAKLLQELVDEYC